MNRYQRILLALAVANGLLILLFPPFNSVPLSKGALASFDGFYPLFSQLGLKPLNRELLSLVLTLLGANALAAWLALQHRGDDEIPRFRYSLGIGCFALVNLAVVLLFPPFEPYSSISKTIPGTFDSFYFAFGHRSQRAVFGALLYLECMFVVINALTLWLLFNAIERSDSRNVDRKNTQANNPPPNPPASLLASHESISPYKHQAPKLDASQPLFPHDDRR